MKYPSRKFAILTFAVIVATTFVFIGRVKTKPPTATAQVSLASYVQSNDKTLYFTPQGITYALTETKAPKQLPATSKPDSFLHPAAFELEAISAQPQQRHAVKLDFIRANPNVQPEAPTEATFNYFQGQPEQWQTGLKTYAKSIYEALWPGIDWEDSGTAKRLKYPFLVKPGAYQTTYSGLTLNESFVTKLNATGNALVYSTYLGSGQGGKDTARSIAVDSIGNAYVTGPGCAPCPILNSAVNSVGNGPPSNSATATAAAATIPGAPRNLATQADDKKNHLGWNAPSSNGGATITSYRVFRGTTSSNQQLVTSGGCANLGAVLACTDTGLTNGQTYYYIVSAVNSAGQGAPSNQVTATPVGATVPGAPQNLQASASNGQNFLGWQAPSSNGGATITSYRVFRGTTSSSQQIITSGGCANLGAVLACTDTGLTNGQTYYYIVSALNSAGQGPPSNQVTATPVGTPTLSITTTSLPSATVGTGYGEGVTASGGQTPYTWSVSSGLPPGLAINATFGSIFGTPTAAGTFSFTVTVRDSSNPQKTASKVLSLTVNPPTFSITTTSLNPATATVGTGYSAQQAVAATGGQNPYSWSASGLPNGMGINPSSGAVFGTPTVAGPFNFTVTVRDSSSPQKTASKTLSITVTTTPGLVANAGPDQTVRLPATVTLNGSGSTSVLTYTWSFIGKPSGSTATLNKPNTASPNFTPDVPGLYSIRLVITSSGGSAEDTVLVRAETANCTSSALRVYPVSLAARPNQTQEIRGYGGSGNYTWSLVTNASGGSLSSTTGSSINYTAGSNTGQDVIRLTDAWCGTAEVKAQVTSATASAVPEVGDISVNPNPTAGATSVKFQAKFSAPASEAKLCLNDGRVAEPGNCNYSVSLSADGLSAAATVSTLNLPKGAHNFSLRARNQAGWGRQRNQDIYVSATKVVVLLLNGYNFFNTGKMGEHPEQWWQFDTSIACQIEQDLFGISNCNTKTSLNTLTTSCSPGNTGANVCVVDNLNGRGPVETTTIKVPTGSEYVPSPLGCPIPVNYADKTFKGNVELLDEYINARKWIRDADQIILIGHSYGGLISRAYAYRHPDKVKAILTLDTPHTGTAGLANFLFTIDLKKKNL